MFTLKLEIIDNYQRTREKHLFLSQKLNAYKNGQISRFEFIKTVSFKFLPGR